MCAIVCTIMLSDQSTALRKIYLSFGTVIFSGHWKGIHDPERDSRLQFISNLYFQCYMLILTNNNAINGHFNLSLQNIYKLFATKLL